MNKILDMLFIREKVIEKECFRNLYYSSDKSSFAGYNYNILCENKIYDEYKIIKDVINEIGEFHKEYKAFIKLKDILYFIRILTDNDDKCYDILMYKVDSDSSYRLYDKVFFPFKIIIPESLSNFDKCLIFVNEHVNIIKNEGMFSKYLEYEDWDYKNKCLNMIDVSCVDNIIDDFKNKDFKKKYCFKKNGGEKIYLELSFKYIDGFYYIDGVNV